MRMLSQCPTLSGLKDKIEVDTNLIIRIKRAKAEYYITESSPANLMFVPYIKVYDKLDSRGFSEAVSHELGHVAANWEGIITVFYKNININLNPLTTAINNALSHKWLINYLAKDNIPSGKHLELLGKKLETFNQDIIEYRKHICSKVLLHALGVQLFDISITDPKKNQQIEELIRGESNCKMAFQLAKKYLSSISPDMDQIQQFKKIKKFIKKLGYKSCFLKLRCY